MTLWSVVQSLFSDPKAWVPIVVSIAALVLSGITASQTWRYYPRPRLEFEKSTTDYLPVEMRDKAGKTLSTHVSVTYEVKVTNWGNGVAHDVRANSVKFGNLLPGAAVSKPVQLSYTVGKGPAPHLVVTWLRYPGPRKQRYDFDHPEIVLFPVRRRIKDHLRRMRRRLMRKRS